LYAPLAGLGVLGGIAVQRVGALLSPPVRRAGLAAIALLLVGWAGLSAARCAVWHDEDSLFGDAVAAGAASPRVWYNYGNTLLQRGAVAEAADVFAGAVERAPRDAIIWTNLGVARQRQGSYDAAERAYRRAAELAPHDGRILENLGTLYLARGDLGAARVAFTSALELDPRLSTARRALAAIEPAAPQR
jgi:tetratricopeptide (TPR) repeat protein